MRPNSGVQGGAVAHASVCLGLNVMLRVGDCVVSAKFFSRIQIDREFDRCYTENMQKGITL